MLCYGLPLALMAFGIGWDTNWFRDAPGGAGNGTLPGGFFLGVLRVHFGPHV
jgi:hypothetical protein